MRVSKAIALAIVLAAPGLVSVSSAQTASECPVAGILSTWGINSTGVFNVASGGACLFPLRIEGVIAGSSIVQNPDRSAETTQRIHIRVHGKPRLHRPRYLLRSGDRQGAYGFRHVGNHPDCNGSIALIRTLTRLWSAFPTGKWTVVSRRGLNHPTLKRGYTCALSLRRCCWRWPGQAWRPKLL